MNLTYNNHLTWSVTDALTDKVTEFGTRRNSTDRFSFGLGRCARQPKSWAEELDIALEQLVATHSTKLALFYSGGSDSEVILRALLKLGVQPEIHTIRFTSGANDHETRYAMEFCKSVGVKHHVWDFDIDRYIANQEYLNLGLRYSCSQIAYLCVVEHVKLLDRVTIMGGEVMLQKHPIDDGNVHSPSEWYYTYREDEDGMTYRYSYGSGHPLINEIFTYTPELLYSWLMQPEIRAVALNEVPGKLTLLSIKKLAYEAALGIELSAPTKFNGYERITWRNMAATRDLAQHLPRMRMAKLEYNQLLKDLYDPNA